MFRQALEVPQTGKYTAAQRMDVIAGSAEQFAAFVKSEYSKWQKMVEATGIKA